MNFNLILLFMIGQLSLWVVIHPGLSSSKGCLVLQIVFQESLSSIKRCLPSWWKHVFKDNVNTSQAFCKHVFEHKVGIQGKNYHNGVIWQSEVLKFLYEQPSLKVIFHHRSSSINGCLHSIKGRLPSKVVFHSRLSSTPELPPRYPQSESSNMSLVV